MPKQKKPTIIFDAELQRYIDPPKQSQTIQELEALILEDGRAINPLHVWKGHDILIDGHRRYEICKKHNLPFEVHYREFPNRDAVKYWMNRWQMSVRNMTARQFADTVNRMVELRAKEVGRGKAIDEVSQDLDLSKRTIQRNLALKKAVDSMPEDVAARFHDGTIKCSQPALIQFAGLGEVHQRIVLREWDSGDYRTLGEILTPAGSEEESPESEPSPGDSLSQGESAPEKEEPEQRSGPQLIQHAEKALGAVQRAFDLLQDGHSDPTRHVRAKNHLTQLQGLLDEWCE